MLPTTAYLDLDEGTVTMRLLTDVAPVTVARFAELNEIFVLFALVIDDAIILHDRLTWPAGRLIHPDDDRLIRLHSPGAVSAGRHVAGMQTDIPRRWQCRG